MALCGSRFQGRTPTVFDPFAPSTGGREQRTAIFGDLSKLRPDLFQAGEDAAAAGREAANDPALGAIRNYANRTLAGDFLRPSPELEAGLARLRAQSNREAGNTLANIQEAYNRNGLAFSTANQQAQQAAQAASSARASDTEAGTRLQNYLTERANQSAAVPMLQSVIGAPMNYLAESSVAPLAPLQQMAQIVAGLSSGQQIAPKTYLEKDEPLRAMFKTVGAL
jgi:hypothetical protein